MSDNVLHVDFTRAKKMEYVLIFPIDRQDALLVKSLEAYINSLPQNTVLPTIYYKEIVSKEEYIFNNSELDEQSLLDGVVDFAFLSNGINIMGHVISSVKIRRNRSKYQIDVPRIKYHETSIPEDADFDALYEHYFRWRFEPSIEKIGKGKRI